MFLSAFVTRRTKTLSLLLLLFLTLVLLELRLIIVAVSQCRGSHCFGRISIKTESNGTAKKEFHCHVLAEAGLEALPRALL